MLSELSVKKPMTIFVSVVLVIVLGIVSFSRMTPDLMPNMDLPYALVLTTYIGQSPETVESVVTKPLEQSVSVIDGVKQVRSSSSENYSMCVIEFNDGTDMNTATVDVRTALDSLSDMQRTLSEDAKAASATLSGMLRCAQIETFIRQAELQRGLEG